MSNEHTSWGLEMQRWMKNQIWAATQQAFQLPQKRTLKPWSWCKDGSTPSLPPSTLCWKDRAGPRSVWLTLTSLVRSTGTTMRRETGYERWTETSTTYDHNFIFKLNFLHFYEIPWLALNLMQNSLWSRYIDREQVNVIVTSSTIDIFFEITKFSKILSKFTFISNILSKFDKFFEIFRKKGQFRKYFRKFCNFENSVMVDEVNISLL